MKTINNDYAIDIDYRDTFNTTPCEDECRLVLQFMPELYADMMLLIKEEAD